MDWFTDERAPGWQYCALGGVIAGAAIDKGDHWEMLCRLPGIRVNVERASTVEDARDAVETAVLMWIEAAGLVLPEPPDAPAPAKAKAA